MASLLRELLNDEVGTSALAGSRPSWSERLGSRHWEGERTRCSLGGDGSIMCGEAGCLHCGFTSATSHLLFKTIINCSIIQMIFTRANYTGPHPAEKMAGVFYCSNLHAEECAAEAVQVGLRNLWLDLFSSLGVSPHSQELLWAVQSFITHFSSASTEWSHRSDT